MGTPELTGVARTLLVTLRARALEQQQPRPVIQDPVAVWWSAALPWGEDLEGMYQRFRPFLQSGVGLRAREIDRLVGSHITTCDSPVVVELGAGMSTRFHRLKELNPRLRWLELDLDDVIALRREVDDETDCHRFVSRSVFDWTWMDEVPAAAPEDVLFVAEGLFMYFDRTKVGELIRTMHTRFPGAGVIFDLTGRTGGRINSGLQRSGVQARLTWLLNGRDEIEELGVHVESLKRIITPTAQRTTLLRRALALTPGVDKLPLVVVGKV